MQGSARGAVPAAAGRGKRATMTTTTRLPQPNDRLAARLGDLDDYDGGHTFRGAREAIHPGRLTGPRSQQPGAVLGTRTLLGDALAAGRLRPPNVGQRTISATAHADGFSDNDLRTAAARLGLVPDDDRTTTGDAPETSP